MRSMLRHWIVLLAWLAAVSGSVEVLPSKTCIDHCVCRQVNSVFDTILQVVQCDRPITLNSTTFKNLDPIRYITLNFERMIIDQIHEDAFSKFINVEDVVFRRCNIGSIDAKTFSNVKRVNFADCRFEDRPDLASKKLEELQFGNCQLEEIPKLNNLLALSFLNLTGNLIKNIDIDTFAESFDLAELHLSDNEIFKIPPTIFINNRELNTLFLDNNPLKEFALNTSENLSLLSLRNCQLETFDEKSTLKLSSLNELYLSHNRIKHLSRKTFAGMKDLASLDLSHNKISHLDDDIFASNSRLGKIILDGNSLNTLPNFYLEGGLNFATITFSCNHCNISSLPGSVFKSMSLLRLYLSHNQLSSVENVFDKIPSLMHLDISYNVIPKLTKKTFYKNNNLVRINIAGNPLGVLDPEVFNHNNALNEIDARNTSLSKLWSHTNVKLENLQKILIGNNNLTALTVRDFDVMPSLDGIELNNNPLVFNSDLCDVFESIERKLPKHLFILEAKPKLRVGYEKDLEEDSNGFVPSDWNAYMSDKCYLEGFEDYATYDDYNADVDEDNEYDNDVDGQASQTITHDDANNNFSHASYILSVTSVFVLSALVVLTVAVTLTLCVLKRNANMQRANLPRLKIPLWNSTPGQKKHSGSVYRPLSEEIIGPQTPKFSRYEFTSTPTIHSANP